MAIRWVITMVTTYGCVGWWSVLEKALKRKILNKVQRIA